MAATITRRNVLQSDNYVVYVFDIVGSNSYPTGGEAEGTSDWKKITGGKFVKGDLVSFRSNINFAATPAKLNVVWDATNSKWVFLTGATEVTNATDLSAQTVRCEAVFAAPTSKDAA